MTGGLHRVGRGAAKEFVNVSARNIGNMGTSHVVKRCYSSLAAESRIKRNEYVPIKPDLQKLVDDTGKVAEEHLRNMSQLFEQENHTPPLPKKPEQFKKPLPSQFEGGSLLEDELATQAEEALQGDDGLRRKPKVDKKRRETAEELRESKIKRKITTEVVSELKGLQKKHDKNPILKASIGKALRLIESLDPTDKNLGMDFTRKLFDSATSVFGNFIKEYKNDKSEMIVKFKKEHPKAHEKVGRLCEEVAIWLNKIDDPKDYIKFYQTLSEYAQYRSTGDDARSKRCITTLQNLLSDKGVGTGKISFKVMDQFANYFVEGYKTGNDPSFFMGVANAKPIPFKLIGLILTAAYAIYKANELRKLKDDMAAKEARLMEHGKNVRAGKLFSDAALPTAESKAEESRKIRENKKLSSEEKKTLLQKENEFVEMTLVLEKHYKKIFEELTVAKQHLEKTDAKIKKLDTRPSLMDIPAILNKYVTESNKIKKFNTELESVDQRTKMLSKELSEKSVMLLSHRMQHKDIKEQLIEKRSFLETLKVKIEVELQSHSSDFTDVELSRALVYINKEMGNKEPKTPEQIFEGYIKCFSKDMGNKVPSNHGHIFEGYMKEFNKD